MEFVTLESEKTFVSMLQKFSSVIPVSPAMVPVDHDARLIATVIKVMPRSYLTVDKRHLNMNQLENVGSWCQMTQRPS